MPRARIVAESEGGFRGDAACVFPSLSAREMLAVLTRKPLAYVVVRTSGSHRRLESPNGYPPLTFSFHDGDTLPSGLVRKILCRDVGLTEQQARELV
jgi:predicted RNA binding protein YcfA (HicA-like mRNA interferase family)